MDYQRRKEGSLNMAAKRLRITLDEARSKLFSLPVPLKSEEIPVLQSRSRVLAEDVVSGEMVPPFAKSPLDGYAFRSEDTGEASQEYPVTLRINQEIPCGGVPVCPVHHGEAAKILTGAPLPEHADTVVRFESTSFTDTEVTLYEPARPNSNVVPVGDDVRKGDLLASAGTRINPPLQGLFSAVGMKRVRVWKRPVVTIINTGNELLPPGQPLTSGKIHNSSFAMLSGYLQIAGAEVRQGGIVGDNAQEIAAAVEAGIHCSDMVITTGGVSVGDYDMVRAAMKELGAEELFWKVRMRPGGTLLAAAYQGKLILSLSGNPASAALGLHLLGLPYVARLAGRGEVFPERIRVKLLEPVLKDSSTGRLLRGHLVIQDGTACFRPVEAERNGALSSLMGCDLIGDLPAETPPLERGAFIDAYWLRQTDAD